LVSQAWLFAAMAVRRAGCSPCWLFGRYGCFAAMAVSPQWLFGCDCCPGSLSALLARGTAGSTRRFQQLTRAGQMSDTARGVILAIV
jgi:hypothetical protein